MVLALCGTEQAAFRSDRPHRALRLPTVDRFAAWVERYLVAWDSNDPDDIAALFSEDALYFTLPMREPWRGRKTIVREWLDRKDESGDWWTFKYEVIARDGDLGIVRGVTEYATMKELSSRTCGKSLSTTKTAPVGSWSGGSSASLLATRMLADLPGFVVAPTGFEPVLPP